MRFSSEARRIIYDSITIGANDFLRGHFLLAESRRSKTHLLGAKAALFSQLIAPKFMRNVVTNNYRKHSLEILGLGYHSVVVADGKDNVRKIHHRTLHMLPEQRRAYIDRLYHKQHVLCEFFPETAIAHQDFVVEEFPLNPKLPVVVSKQPRMYGDFLERDEVLNNTLLTNASTEMHEQARTLPDIVGTENVIIPENGTGPVIIDTIPLSEHDPHDFAAYQAARTIMHNTLHARTASASWQ